MVTTIALAWVALAYCLGGRGAEGPKASPTPLYYGAKPTCSNMGCHSGPPNTEEVLVCRCTEYKTWSLEDKHEIAYKVLLSERAKKMGELLRYKVPVSEHDACLSCHSVVIRDAKLEHKSFKRDEGVTCVVCHGAYEEWVDRHYSYLNLDKWRAFSRQVKEEKFGMTDLWTPLKRADLCASCHVGNLKPDEPAKFVTHEMYAAGHPPLPGFESATFSDQMPKHWQYLREKPDKVKKLLRYDDVDRERTKLILVGAAVSLRESMRLLHRQADDCVKAVDPDKRALNLANFDCYACHHDLKSPSWRQARGYNGKPGRVPMRPWPTALVKLAIRHATDENAEAKEMEGAFTEKWRRLQTAFEDRPFGDPKKIAPAADDLTTWANALAEKLDNKPCDQAAARKLLAQLPSMFQGGTPDYDSARQIAWAFQVMYQELEAKPDPRVEEVIAMLKKELKLDLPSGRKRNISDELAAGLERLNSYNPSEFNKALEKLAVLVKDN